MNKFTIYLLFIFSVIRLTPVCGQTVIANYKQQIAHPAIAKEGSLIWLGTKGEGIMKCDLAGNILERYTSIDGLSDNTVYDIVIDQQGRQWFATEGGISVLTPTNELLLLATGRVKSFDIAPNGDIWATGNNKVYQFDVSSLTKTTLNLAHYFGSAIRIAPDQTIYVCGDEGLAVRNPSTLVWSYYLTFSDPFDDQSIQDIEFDKQGNLWVIKGSALFTFSNGIFTSVIGSLVNALPNTYINSPLALDKLSNGDLLIGNLYGFWIYNGAPDILEFTNKPRISAVYDFSIADNGSIFLATNFGFSSFDGSDFAFYFPDNNTLASENVSKILVDENDKKWFLGSFARTEFDNTLWETYSNDSYQNPIGRPFDASFEPDGTKWFTNIVGGSSSTRLIRLRNDSITIMNAPAAAFGFFTRLAWDPIQKRTIFKTEMSEKGFWYCENDSLLSFEIPKSSLFCEGFDFGCSNGNQDQIRHFFISAKGNYVWASQIGYLYTDWGYSQALMQDTFVYSCGSDRDPCPSPYWDYKCGCNNTNYVAFDSTGRTWVASDNGIYIYTNLGDISQSHFGTADSGLPNDTVHCIVFDALGRAWIGTQSGLAIVDNNLDWKVLTVDNADLAGNNIQCITFDTDGSAWVGTKTGVSHLSATTSIYEVPKNASPLAISPNPASESVTVIAPIDASGNLRLYTTTGALINVISEVTPGQPCTFDIQSWPPGVYFATFATRENGNRCGRFVVQR